MPISDPGSAYLLTPPYTPGQQRIEAAISLDGGATAATEWQIFAVPVGGGVFVVGGLGLLWGREWAGADFASPGLALMLRRPGASGESALTARLIDHAYLAVHHTAGAVAEDMAERITSKQIILFNPEGTKGTKQATTRRLMAGVVDFSPVLTQEPFRAQGDSVDTIFPVLHEQADGTLSGKPCFNEVGWHLSSVIAKPVTGSPTTGVYEHEFVHSMSGNDDPHSFSFEIGDANTRAHQVVYALLNSFNIGGPAKQVPSMGGTFIAKGFSDGITMTAGANEVQTMTQTGGGTGGTYRLRFMGKETTDLAISANASAIQAAIQALSTVGSGNMLVSGTGPFVFTAAGALAGKELELIRVVKKAFTGGTTPDATIVKTTRGGYTLLDVVPILGNPEVYAASTFEGLSGGKLTKVTNTQFSADSRWGTATYQDGTLTWAEHYEDAGASKFGIDLTLQANSSGMAYLPKARSQEQVYLKLTWKGPLISGSYYNQVDIYMSAKVSAVKSFEDADGVYAYGYSFGAARDPLLGWAVKVVVTNTVASYAS